VSTTAYNEAAPEDREHFMKCEECGEMFDMRQLDEVFYHAFDHKQRPDIPYTGSERKE
jgi:hypothetical protein